MQRVPQALLHTRRTGPVDPVVANLKQRADEPETKTQRAVVARGESLAGVAWIGVEGFST